MYGPKRVNVPGERKRKYNELIMFAVRQIEGDHKEG
jgi:hypothetical protein